MMPDPLNPRQLVSTGIEYPLEKKSNLYWQFMLVGEKILLETILKQVCGNQLAAASLLDLNRNTLRKKMKMHGLEARLDRRSMRVAKEMKHD